MKKTIVQAGAAAFQNKRALVRVDFNVPQNKDGTPVKQTGAKDRSPASENSGTKQEK